MAHRPGLTTDTVVRAAADLVDAEGPEALNLARLAGKLGVRTPSLYNHITSLSRLRQGASRRLRHGAACGHPR